MQDEPFSIEAFQQHIRQRYYAADIARGTPATFLWFIEEVGELATALQRVPEPVVVLGDFNLRETDVEYRVLRGLTGLRDAAAESGRREPTVDGGNPFRQSDREPKRIDYVLVRDGGTTGLRVTGLHRVFDRLFAARGRTASFSNHAGLVAELEFHGDPRPRMRPDGGAVDLAANLHARGRARTEGQRSRARIAASAGWAGALLATLGARDARLSRRTVLRRAIQIGGVAALTPAVGCALLAEVFTPDEIRAFDQLRDRLNGLLH